MDRVTPSSSQLTALDHPIPSRIASPAQNPDDFLESLNRRLASICALLEVLVQKNRQRILAEKQKTFTKVKDWTINGNVIQILKKENGDLCLEHLNSTTKTEKQIDLLDAEIQKIFCRHYLPLIKNNQVLFAIADYTCSFNGHLIRFFQLQDEVVYQYKNQQGSLPFNKKGFSPALQIEYIQACVVRISDQGVLSITPNPQVIHQWNPKELSVQQWCAFEDRWELCKDISVRLLKEGDDFIWELRSSENEVLYSPATLPSDWTIEMIDSYFGNFNLSIDLAYNQIDAIRFKEISTTSHLDPNKKITCSVWALTLFERESSKDRRLLAVEGIVIPKDSKRARYFRHFVNLENTPILSKQEKFSYQKISQTFLINQQSIDETIKKIKQHLTQPAHLKGGSKKYVIKTVKTPKEVQFNIALPQASNVSTENNEVLSTKIVINPELVAKIKADANIQNWTVNDIAIRVLRKQSGDLYVAHFDPITKTEKQRAIVLEPPRIYRHSNYFLKQSKEKIQRSFLIFFKPVIKNNQIIFAEPDYECYFNRCHIRFFQLQDEVVYQYNNQQGSVPIDKETLPVSHQIAYIKACLVRISSQGVLSISPNPQMVHQWNPKEFQIQQRYGLEEQGKPSTASYVRLLKEGDDFIWEVRFSENNVLHSGASLPSDWTIEMIESYCENFNLIIDLVYNQIHSIKLKEISEKSHLDPTQRVNSDTWAVTLIDNGRSGSEPCSWKGHSRIVIEGMRIPKNSKRASYFVGLGDVRNAKSPSGSATVYYTELSQVFWKNKSPTFLIDRQDGEHIIDRIQEQSKSPVSYNFFSNNCATWALKMVEILGIRLSTKLLISTPKNILDKLVKDESNRNKWVVLPQTSSEHEFEELI